MTALLTAPLLHRCCCCCCAAPDILALDEPSLELNVDFLHFWANNGEFTQCVIAHMENADVSRLLLGNAACPSSSSTLSSSSSSSMCKQCCHSKLWGVAMCVLGLQAAAAGFLHLLRLCSGGRSSVAAAAAGLLMLRHQLHALPHSVFCMCRVSVAWSPRAGPAPAAHLPVQPEVRGRLGAGVAAGGAARGRDAQERAAAAGGRRSRCGQGLAVWGWGWGWTYSQQLLW
jgi:hypothetical protein